VAEQHLAGLGQPYAAGAGRALDQTPSHEPFEGRDLLADRGLDIAEPRGGAPEGALFGDSLEGGQVADLDARGVIDLPVLGAV
jgi:hypothetical protein